MQTPTEHPKVDEAEFTVYDKGYDNRYKANQHSILVFRVLVFANAVK